MFGKNFPNLEKTHRIIALNIVKEELSTNIWGILRIVYSNRMS